MGSYADYKKRKGEIAQSTEVSSPQQKSSYQRYKERQRAANPGYSVDTEYQSLIEDYKTFAAAAQADSENVGYGNAMSYLTGRSDAAKNLRDRANKLYSYMYFNRDMLDTKAYEAAVGGIEAIEKDVGRTMDFFGDRARYFSQWDTEDDYNTFATEQKAYENQLHLDTDAAAKEIAQLENYLKDYDNLTRWAQDEAGQQRENEYRSKYGSVQDLRGLINEKKAYLNTAKRMQEGVRLAGVADPTSEHYDPEFKAKSGYVSTKADNGWDKLWSGYGLGYKDMTYEYINNQNGIRSEIKRKHNISSSDNPFSDGESTYEEKHYDYMNADEIALYNYYYATSGKDAAEKYLDSIQETLNYRSAQKRYGNLEGNTALELLFGIEAGLDQFGSGVKSLLSDGYSAPSDTQMLSGMVREDLKDNGPKLPDWLGGGSLAQTGYDAITTTANMAPSILTSLAVGTVSKTAGAAMGNALMGASAAGSAYQEKLNMGYTKEQAGAYGMAIGASEIILEKALGGITAFGGGTISKAVAKNLNKVDNVLSRFAKSVGGKVLMNAGSEALEEGLQTVLEPYLWRAVSGEEVSVEWEEALYSALLGAVSGGLFEGGGAMIGHVQGNSQTKQLYGASQQELVTEALEIDPENAFAKKMQAKLDAGKDLSGSELNKLMQQNEASINAQDALTGDPSTQQTASPSDRGRKPGWNPFKKKNTAQTAENTIFSEALDLWNDGTLTDVQWYTLNDTLKNSGAEAAAEQLRSFVSKKNGASVVSEATTPQISSEATAAMAQINGTNIRPVENNNATEGVYTASEDGQTYFKGDAVNIQSVASIQNGTMKLKLEDGRTVDAKDMEYGSADEAVVYETVAGLGVHALGANMLIENYTPGGDVSAMVYAKGIEEAYKLGQMNVPQAEVATMPFASQLTTYQRQAAYQLGELFGGKQTAKEQAIVRKNRNVEGADTSKGKVHFEGDRNSLNKTQKASLDAMEVLAKALGVQIYVFESEVGSNGKRMGANGWYDPRDGSIHIDLYAGADGKGTMLFTVAHELTHFIRQWSPAKFKVLANVLMKQYGKKGVSVNELVQHQIDKAKRGGLEISYDTAYEEVVADSMETMLADGSVIEMMAELKQQDKTLWSKIRDWFKDLAGKFQAVVDAYKGARPDSVEGRLVADMQDMIGTLQALYMDALADASENFDGGGQKNTTRESGAKYSQRYLDADTNSEILNMVNRVANGDFKASEKVYLGTVTDAIADQINELTGIQVDGFKVAVEARQIDHILKGHGVNGVSDQSMADPDDIARMEYALNSPDDIRKAGKTQAYTYMRNGRNRTADTVLYEKQIGVKSYYVVQAVPDTKAKTVYIVTAFIGESGYKKEAPQLINAKGPDATAKTGSVNASMDSISGDDKNVNKKFSIRDSLGNTLSNEQQAYFKDSKVRDEQGRLLVMYHGTSNGGFTVFDAYGSNFGLFGQGLYFTDNPDVAQSYTNKGRGDRKQVYKAYLNITNPMDMDAEADLEKWTKAFENIDADEFYLDGVKTNEDAFKALKEYLADAGYYKYDAWETISDALIFMGYDGVTHIGGGRFNKKDGTRHRVFVAFEPEQVKDVKNTAPTTHPDIRYSQRDGDHQAVAHALEKENAKLREDVAELRELVKLQRSVTGGAKFTKTSVEGEAKNLKKYANAKGDTKELAKLINGLYEYIASGKELTWEDVREQAQGAVDWLWEHIDRRTKPSEYAQDILKQIRGSRVHLDESQMAEVEYQFGSYNDYRKSLMGNIIFAKDANMSLDSLWQELAELYPDVFDRETSSADMPGALVDIIHRLRNPDTTMDYARNREMMEQELLQQVYDSYWRVSTLYTVADVKQRQINRLKGEHFQRMNKLKQDHRENVARLKQAHEERLKKVREDYRNRMDTKVQKITERYQESRKKGVEGRRKTEMRHKIQKVVKKLNDLLLNETKDHHVPDNLKKAVAEALDAINMDTVGANDRIAKYDDLIAKATDPDVIASLTETRDRIAASGERLADRIRKLKAAYDSIKTGAESASISVYDEVIANKIQEVVEQVGNTALRDMSLEQLEAVHEMYTMIAKSISNANKIFMEARGATIMQMGTSAIREVKAAGGGNQYALKVLEGAKKFGWDLLKPYYAFSLIGSDTLSKLYGNVRKGEDVWAVDVSAARKFFREQARMHGYDEWDMSKEYAFQDVSGREFKVSLQQIMSLYAYSKRAQADKHLEKGGFVFDSAVEVIQKKGGIPVKYRVNTANAYNLNRMQINEIVDTLSDEQIAFVDAMQDYLSTVMGEKGNDVSLELYDVRLFKEKNYFPLKSASQYTFQQTENSGEVKLKNSGFSKKTVVNASNPIILSDFMSVWGGHVNDMSMYHAFVLPLEDFNRVYNYKTLTSEETSTQSVKAALQNAYGVASTKYIKQMLEDINGGARADDRASILSRWMGKFKKGSVFANASVVIQQPSAIARAAALLDLQHFIGPKISQKRHKQLWEEVKQYAPVAIIKEMGYFDTNMGLSTVEYLTAKEYETIGDKAKAMFTDGNYRDEVLSRPAALADELSWCYIWEAVKRETRGNNPGMDVRSEQFLKKAGERFTEVVTRTQVYDSVLSRSGLMRSKDTGAKMMTAFMSEPTTSMNMVFDALVQGKRGKRWYTRNAIGAVIASQVLNSLLVAIVYAARDDDEDKTYVEKYLANFVAKTLDSLNPLSYLPFIKDIVSITRGYTVERSDMAVISDIWAAWQKLPNENVGLYRKIEDFGGSIAQAFGVPLKNIMRDIRAIVQTVQSFLNGPETTGMGIGTAIKEEVSGKEIPKHRQLYDAIIQGNGEHRDRIAAEYADETALESAIRKGLREFDARICEAAEARYHGDFGEYERIFGEIEKEGHFTHSQIAGAVQAEINDMDDDESGRSSPKKYGMYGIDDFMLAVDIGDSAMAENIREEIIRTGQENGKSVEKAEDSFVSSVVSACKERYLAGTLSEENAIGLLTEYCDRSRSEAQANISYWEYKQDNPDAQVSAQWFDTYYEKIESSGIDLDTYVTYRNEKTGLTKRDEVLGIIDAQQISDDQKDALYFAEGYAKSTLDEAPWHQ